MRQLAKRAVLEREDLGRLRRRGIEHGHLAVARHRQRADHAAAIDQLLHRAAADGNLADVPRAVVGEEEDDRLAVGA